MKKQLYPKYRLSAILAQYDRKKYKNAVERLIWLLDGLNLMDYRIAVVDNANEGSWFHPITERLVHVGGDNSAFEFSAFEKGVSFFEEEEVESDLYAFVTDAYLAYGDDYLELIDDAALRYSLDLQACVGWADSFMQDCTLLDYSYRSWLRTSFLLMPAQILPIARPLNFPIDRAAFFSSNPKEPFLATAPIGSNLQALFLSWLTTNLGDMELEEHWHSRFELNDATFPFFKNKICAIFREHILSARLRSKGVKCFDFRLVRCLSRSNSIQQQLPEKLKVWQWLGWREDFDCKKPRFFIDTNNLPVTTEHGARQFLSVSGWVASEPQVREVGIRLSDGRTFSAPCDIPRADVLRAHSDFTDKHCGFSLSRSLESLAPGDYEVELEVPRFDIKEHLGSIRVLPSFKHTILQQFISRSVTPGEEVAVFVDSELLSTEPISRVDVFCDLEPAEVKRELAEKQRKRNGLYRYQLIVLGNLRVRQLDAQHVLELRFYSEGGTEHTRSVSFFVESRNTVSHSVAFRDIGFFDPSSEGTHVHLEGSIFAAQSGDRVILKRAGRPVLEEKLVLSSLLGTGDSLGSFRIYRSVSEIPPGIWDFELTLAGGVDGKEKTLTSWSDAVRILRPAIDIDHFELSPAPNGAKSFLLKMSGWTTSTCILSCLQLFVDGKLLAPVALDRFRPEVKSARGGSLTVMQGLSVDMPLEIRPGKHAFRLVTRKAEGPRAEWSKTIVLEKSRADDFRLFSKDLAELESRSKAGERLVASSWIIIRGSLVADLDGVVLKLFVDGELVDQSTLDDESEFFLRWLPAKEGTCSVRVTAQWQKRVLYDSGNIEIETRKVKVDRRATASLKRFIERFEIDCFSELKTDELMLQLMELELENLPEFVDLLRRVGRKLKLPAKESIASQLRSLDLGLVPAEPLRILMAAWESPCLRHGGGVCLANLLKQLSDRHRITLIHSYGVDEEGWSDEVRPYVEKLIRIPRRFQETFYRPEPGLPEAYYFNYTPELRAAIQRELSLGDYDLVNYEYTTMYPHIVRSSVPSTLVVHELPISAKLTSYFQDALAPGRNLDELRDLLKSFYFLSDLLPSKCDRLIALTEEDAIGLLELNAGANVYVNKIGVDCKLLAPPEGAGASRARKASSVKGKDGRGDPTFVFLGNFRHPPNVAAVEYFGVKVMPMVLRESPQASFVVIGGFVPDELAELEGRNNVRFEGFVDDFRPYLWQATAFVSPLFLGAGMRVKILEAMACGSPIIGTELAMQGMEAEPGKHYLRAETAAEFASQSVRLIKDRRLWSRLRGAGLKLVETRHDWPIRAREREAIWQDAISDKKVRARRKK